MATQMFMGGLPLGVPEPPPPYIPYVPPKEDAELVASCAAVLKKNPKQINALSDQEAVLFSREIMEALLPILQKHGKSMFMLSSVNKCAYFFAKKHWATKDDSYWIKNLSGFLPNVKFLPPNQCSYSYPEQFKVIVHQFNAACRPYRIELKRCWDTYNVMKKEHDELSKSIQTTTKAAALKARKERVILGVPLTHDPVVLGLCKRLEELKLCIIAICGQNPRNPCINSIVGKTLDIIRTRIPAGFNDQAEFENVIRQSEARKNGAPMELETL